MKKIGELRFTRAEYPEVVALASELAELQERRTHDAAARLFIRAARSKIASLKRQRK